MNDLIINKEKLATRCEICHQDDMFLPEPNICFRCVEVDFDDEPKPKKKTKRVASGRYKLPLQTVAVSLMVRPLNVIGRPVFAKMGRTRIIKLNQRALVQQQALADRAINAKKRLLVVTFILATLLSLIFFLNQFAG